MKKIHRLLIVLTLLTMGQSCDNDSILPYDYESIWNCHHKSNWTLESTKSKIIGIWEWKYTKCCGYTSNPYQNNTESKGLKVEFKNDGTGVLIEDNAMSDFTWTISTYTDIYSFEITPFIPQLNGQLLFCDNIMMCNASYFDGADNFFVKKN